MLLMNFLAAIVMWISACSGAVIEPSPTPPDTLTPPPPGPPNHVPTPQDVSVDIPPVIMNIPYTYAVGATDADGDSIMFFVVTPPTRGTLAMQSDGRFTYTPAHNDFTSDSTGFRFFDWRVTDGKDTSDVQRVFLGIDAPPIARNDTFVITTGSTLVVAPPGLVANDNDPNGDTFDAGFLQEPLHGLLGPPPPTPDGVYPTGGFTYTPNSGFLGLDSLPYVLQTPNSTALMSDVAWVYLLVEPESESRNSH